MLVMAAATTVTTTAVAIGTRVTVAGLLATRGNSSIVLSVLVSTRNSTKREIALVNVEVSTSKLTAAVMTTTIIVAVTGTAVTAAAQAATRDSGTIALSASVRIQHSRRPTSVQATKEVVVPNIGLVTVGATMTTTTAHVVGIKVTAAENLAITVSMITAKRANASTHQRRRQVAQGPVSVVPNHILVTAGVMTRTTTADATGTMAIAVALLVTSCSSSTVRPANVSTRRRRTRQSRARAPAELLLLRATSAATMTITIAVVAGTVATVVERVVTSTSIRIAPNVYVKITRKRNRKRVAAHVVLKLSRAMGDATMKTTTVVAIGTVVIAAARAATNGNTRTARNANVRTQRNKRMRQNVRDTAEVQTLLVTATAMTRTTTAVADTTGATVVAKVAPNGNIRTVLCASAWTRLNSDRSKLRKHV